MNMVKVTSWSWLIFFGLALIASIVFSENLSKAQTNGKSAKIISSKNDVAKRKKIAEFQKLLQIVADGWNEGNARKAADCFTEDAIYIEPPDKQIYVGRKALFEFFGGDKNPDPPMSMTWHHRAFNEDSQIGFGEYTYQGGNRYHGIVIIKIKNGKISNWHEYQYKSNLDWKKFIEKNEF
jgi:SnoaL-like domain